MGSLTLVLTHEKRLLFIHRWIFHKDSLRSVGRSKDGGWTVALEPHPRAPTYCCKPR